MVVNDLNKNSGTTKIGELGCVEKHRPHIEMGKYAVESCTKQYILIYNSVLKCQHTILKSGASTPRTVTTFAVKTAIDLTSTI